MNRAGSLRTISSGKDWEAAAPYSQVVYVRELNLIFVSGQVSLDASGQVVAHGDMEGQARQAFANIRDLLEASGSGMERVIKVTYFTTDMSRWEDVARARAEVFSDFWPASTTMEVSGLHRPEYLIEIEAVALGRDELG